MDYLLISKWKGSGLWALGALDSWLALPEVKGENNKGFLPPYSHTRVRALSFSGYCPKTAPLNWPRADIQVGC